MQKREEINADLDFLDLEQWPLQIFHARESKAGNRDAGPWSVIGLANLGRGADLSRDRIPEPGLNGLGLEVDIDEQDRGGPQQQEPADSDQNWLGNRMHGMKLRVSLRK